MRRVYKHRVSQENVFSTEMPKGAEILTVQTQRENPVMWVLANPENELEVRSFRLAGTGHPITEENLKYIGTFQLFGGDLVGHLFEIMDKK